VAAQNPRAFECPARCHVVAHSQRIPVVESERPGHHDAFGRERGAELLVGLQILPGKDLMRQRAGVFRVRVDLPVHQRVHTSRVPAQFFSMRNVLMYGPNQLRCNFPRITDSVKRLRAHRHMRRPRTGVQCEDKQNHDCADDESAAP